MPIPGHPHPPRPPDRLPFTILNQLDWAAAIAAKVSRHHAFLPHSQERDELVSVAQLVVRSLYSRPVKGTFNRLRNRFINKGFNMKRVPPGGDAEGLFRGWSYPWILSECRREAFRLRNGGTYRTCRPENRPAQVASLGALADEIADDICEADTVEPTYLCRPTVPATMEKIDSVYYGRRLAGRNRAAS